MCWCCAVLCRAIAVAVVVVVTVAALCQAVPLWSCRVHASVPCSCCCLPSVSCAFTESPHKGANPALVEILKFKPQP
jgi:hypothetical protein